MLDSQCGYAIEANIDCTNCDRREDCRHIYEFANLNLEDLRSIMNNLEDLRNIMNKLDKLNKIFNI